MAWTAQNSDTYTCPIDGVEDFFLKTCPHVSPLEREHWTVFLDATLTLGSIDKYTAFERVRLGWTSLRFQQPNIAAVLDKPNAQKVYNVPDEYDLAAWSNETCILVSDVVDADTVMSNAKYYHLPKVYYIEPTHTVLLQFSHWRIDGIGLLMLMDCLLTLIANPLPLDELNWGSETVNLTPPIEVALNLPHSVNEAGEEYGKSTAALLASRLPSAGVAYRGDAQTIPGRSRRIGLILPKSTTQAVVQAARAMGVTVTNVVQAALAKSVFDHIDMNTRGHGFTVLLGHDLRRHMTKPYDQHSYATNVYIAAEFVHHPFAPEAAFADVARTYREQVKNFSPTVFMQSLRSVIGHWVPLLTTPPPEGFPPLSEPQFSSAGHVEKYIKHTYKNGNGKDAFSVDRVRIFLDMLSRQLMLHAMTWRGQLILNLCYNDAYHDAASAREFLETLRGHLEGGLGFEVDAVAV